MTDSPILTPERVAADLALIRVETPHGVPVNVEWVEELADSHEALRAALAAAEEQVRELVNAAQAAQDVLIQLRDHGVAIGAQLRTVDQSLAAALAPFTQEPET